MLERITKIKSITDNVNKYKNNLEDRSIINFIVKDISNFYSAEDSFEQIDALSSMAVYILSLIEEYKEPENFKNKDINYVFSLLAILIENNLIYSNSPTLIDFNKTLTKNELDKRDCVLSKIIFLCKNFIEENGFIFNICLDEKIKELEIILTKTCPMSLKEAKEYVNNFKGKDEHIVEFKEDEDFFYFIIKDYYINNFERTEKIVKSYEPDYSKAFIKN